MQTARALSFRPLPRVTPSKTTLVSPLRSFSVPTTCPSIKATAVANNETLMVDYSSMAASVFPAEACDTLGGDACNVEMYPEVKLNSAPITNKPRTTPTSEDQVEREYLEYNDPKTVFLGEACDDLGGEFCEPGYLTGVY